MKGKKRFFLLAVSGLLAMRPVVGAATKLDARIDNALDSAREQPKGEDEVLAASGDPAGMNAALVPTHY